MFEVDLWFRIQAGKRDSTYRNFQSIVSRVGGECLRHVVIAEIGYDGVLLKIPPDQIRKMLSALENNQQEPLLQFNGVKCFAPMGQTTIMPSKPSAAASLPQKPLPQGYPVAALFDGLPLSQHAALRDRLAIDDPDGYSQQYQANEQRHGTAMASLIIHGDAGANEASIKSKLYVRPVMVPQGANNGAVRDESFLTTELTVDLVHRAVRRLYVKEGGAAAKGPDIRVINLSVGNRLQLFDNELSPWARLLDWLSWKFKVLFIVSAGNHLDDIVIPVTAAHLPTLTDAEFQRHTLHAMWNQKVERRLLAPSESINALTVGALHSQSSSTQGHGSLVDMLRGAAFPSPINPVASGFGRSVKPDLLVPGGIQHYDVIKLGGPSNSTTLGPSSANKQPGQLTAAPGVQAVPPS
ncbi:MAG: S8 family peptidase, partial [Terriglobia bacterium]